MQWLPVSATSPHFLGRYHTSLQPELVFLPRSKPGILHGLINLELSYPKRWHKHLKSIAVPAPPFGETPLLKK